MNRLLLDGNSLKIEDAYRAVTIPSRIAFSPRSLKRVKTSRAIIEKWVKDGEAVYGVTTGFGEFSNVRIAPDEFVQLQENLIMSHSAGTGDPLPQEIVR